MIVRERDALRAFAAVVAGSSVELLGDAWSGRTRVLERVRELYQEAGLSTLTVRGVGDLLPLDALRFGVSLAGPANARTSTPGAPWTPLGLLSRLREDAPAAILIDDADRLDAASWDVIESAAKTLGIGIVAVFASTTPLPERALLRFAHPVVRVELSALGADGVYELVEEIAGGPVSPVLSGRIHTKSAGNLGIAASLTTAAAHAGRMREDRGVWMASDDLWVDENAVTYEAFLSRYTVEMTGALRTLALLGVTDPETARQELGAETLAQLVAQRLIRTYDTGSHTLLTPNPPGLVDYFLRSVEGVQANASDSVSSVDLPVVGRVFADTYRVRSAAASREWKASRSLAHANRLLCLELTGTRDEAAVSRILSETNLSGADPEEELTFRYLRSRWEIGAGVDADSAVAHLTDDVDAEFPYGPALNALATAVRFEMQSIETADLDRLRTHANRSSLNGRVTSIVLAYGLALSGDGVAALDVLGEPFELANDVLQGQYAVARGLALYSCGRLTEAADWASAHVAECLATAERVPLVAHTYIAVLSHCALGNFDEAVAISQAMVATRVDGSALIFPADHAVLYLLAFVATRTGRQRAAIGLRERASQLAGRSEALPFGNEAFVDAAATSISGDGEAAAAQYLNAGRRLAARNYRLASASLTMLSLIAHYDAGLAADFRPQAEAIGGPLYGAYLDGQEALASDDPDALVTVGRSMNEYGAHDEAAMLVTEAVKLYRTRGNDQAANTAQDLVHDILAQPSSGAVTPPAERIGLTQREAELVSYIGDGLSNLEIARLLTVSVRTVEAHLRNIRKKTGAVSRSDLARLAGRNRPAR